MKKQHRKIALEEHFLTPAMEPYWAPTVAGLAPAIYRKVHAALSDFGAARLESMGRAGLTKCILSLSGPGVQVEPDAGKAMRLAAAVNDSLAGEIQKRPDRYAGFAHLALQQPEAAAKELERCVRELGFKGAMINGHSLGHYLDEPRFAPVWERAQELDVPLYLHPADPVRQYAVLEGVGSLRRAMWEWGVETGSQALRIIMSGLFDRFPHATLILGHLGETLPYLLWRLDSRAQLYGLELMKKPSEYIREHVLVTTSGMFSAEPLRCAIDALGADRVMFSADYPFESAEEGGHFMDTVALEEATRAAICHDNAARHLRLE